MIQNDMVRSVANSAKQGIGEVRTGRRDDPEDCGS
jgi:hypothetical protein